MRSAPRLLDWEQKLRRAYLEPFLKFASMSQLEQSLTLAMKLAPLHYAAHYATWILPSMEVKSEMVGMLSFFARQLLTGLNYDA